MHHSALHPVDDINIVNVWHMGKIYIYSTRVLAFSVLATTIESVPNGYCNEHTAVSYSTYAYACGKWQYAVHDLSAERTRSALLLCCVDDCVPAAENKIHITQKFYYSSICEIPIHIVSDLIVITIITTPS